MADLFLSIALHLSFWEILEVISKSAHIGIISKIGRNDYIVGGSLPLLITCLGFYLHSKKKVVLIYIIGATVLSLLLFIGMIYLNDYANYTDMLLKLIFDCNGDTEEYGFALTFGVIWPCASIISVVISMICYKTFQKRRNKI